MSDAFQVTGKNKNALFTLTVHRGDGMALLAMNWKDGEPPNDFVGFAIEYKEPGGTKFFALKNRLSFPESDGSTNPNKRSTRLSPIQKFRWVHFPRNAELSGNFVYRVTPVFMNDEGELSYGEFQDAKIELRRETYPGKLNVTFTRGFVSSQAFVDFYESAGPIKTLLPPKADLGLTFTHTHPKAKEALAWMGFEARSAILELLDEAIADVDAQVRVVAYDLSEREFVERLEQLGDRLQIIIDDSADHKKAHSGESQAAKRLAASAGKKHVHHKFVVIDFNTDDARVYLGSYNFSVAADTKNGENILLIRDRRIATSYAIEALRIFDHYHFRIAQQKAKKARKSLALRRPPKKEGEEAWWAEDYNDPRKARDRELFAG